MLRWPGTVALVLLVCGTVFQAQEEPPAAGLRAKIESARQLMDADPTGAAEALDHLAAESVELRKVRPLTPEERLVHRDLFLLRARSHLELLNNDKVEESLRELLRVDPFFSGDLPPRALEILDRIRKDEGGVLEVASPESGSQVLVDGLDAGVTGDLPLRVSLIAGSYELRLEKPGYQPAVSRVTIAPGQTLSVASLAPVRHIPPVAFLTDRDDIEVDVDNATLGRTTKIPALRGQLSPEESAALDRLLSLSHFDAGTAGAIVLRQPPVDRKVTVRFRRDCLVEESRTFEVTTDSLTKLDPADALLWFGDSSAVQMQPDVGTLRVNSIPNDADLFLNDQMVGRTPFERDVCAGQYRVRVRHRIGSYHVLATIRRGRTEAIDVTLKPGLGFLGGVDTVQSNLVFSADLTTALDRALATAITSFRMATRIDLPPEVKAWTDASTADLVAASDRNDGTTVTRLLRQASDNFDAPLLLAAVRRPGAGAAPGPVDFLLFWNEHAPADRVRWQPPAQDELSGVLGRLNAPGEAADLVYQNDLGIRAVETALPDAPLVIAQVDANSSAAVAGLEGGEVLEDVDGTPMTAAQLSALIGQKRPGDVVTLRVSGAGADSRQVQVPVQRRPRRVPVFDPLSFGNAIIARLNAAMALAASGPDRDLLSFNLALLHMRFGEWREALTELAGVTSPPDGVGVGRGAAAFFRARCHEQLGERDRAVALYQEAAEAAAVPLTDDGASVAMAARLRLAALADEPPPAPPKGVP